ncbi:hypothetical protein ACQ5JZ_13880 [Streptomyces sp. ZG43]|uniref:hypothetical protein n=1 Tax=Streptomyces albidoflavus TaxID=1886 RepID=UPI000316EC93
MKKKITLGKGAGVAPAVLVGLGALGAVVGEEEKAPVTGPEEPAESGEGPPSGREAVAGGRGAAGHGGGEPPFARDSAQAAGFYLLDEQDASVLGRLQVMDRNWTVCSQEPGPGTYPVDTKVTFHAVEAGESC